MTIKLALPLAAVALAGALMTGPAQARSDVHWSVQIGLPIPLPLLPIVVPRYYNHYNHYNHYDYYTPVYSEPVWRDHRYSAPGWRDRDHDGIPDRHDRYDNRRDWPRYGNDRDRDGIADWRDRRDNRR